MLYILCFLLNPSWAFDLPSQMSSSEQKEVLSTVGLGASSKFLSNVYSLGGYHGMEASLSIETIDTKSISQFGNTTTETSTLHLPSITIGKGLYNETDIFFHFVPPTKNQDLTRFGASFRWAFYQALFLPLSFSTLFHANLINIDNSVSTNNLGVDIIMGMNVSDFSLMLGGGWVRSSGRFAGGTEGVTASEATEYHKVESGHFMFGATYNFDPFFVGASVNRYEDVVWNFKSGFLF